MIYCKLGVVRVDVLLLHYFLLSKLWLLVWWKRIIEHTHLLKIAILLLKVCWYKIKVVHNTKCYGACYVRLFPEFRFAPFVQNSNTRCLAIMQLNKAWCIANCFFLCFKNSHAWQKKKKINIVFWAWILKHVKRMVRTHLTPVSLPEKVAVTSIYIKKQFLCNMTGVVWLPGWCWCIVDSCSADSLCWIFSRPHLFEKKLFYFNLDLNIGSGALLRLHNGVHWTLFLLQTILFTWPPCFFFLTLNKSHRQMNEKGKKHIQPILR